VIVQPEKPIPDFILRLNFSPRIIASIYHR
jgi:hypothetical protein